MSSKYGDLVGEIMILILYRLVEAQDCSLLVDMLMVSSGKQS